MNHPRIEELRDQLLSRGYSRRYVSRVCLELEDHVQSILEEDRNGDAALDPPPHGKLERRIGEPAMLVEAIECRPELAPLAQRYPLLWFVVLPGATLCLFSWLMIYLAGTVGDLEITPQRRQWLITGFHFAVGLVPATMVGALTWFAMRGHGHWIMAAIAAGLFSLAGCFRIDLASCLASNGTYYETQWGFNVWQFLAPWLACGLAVAATQAWRYRQQLATEHRHYLIRAAQLPRLVVVVPIVLVVLTLFIISVEQTRRATARHPADNIIDGMNEPGKLAAAKLDLLAKPKWQKQLGLNQGQIREIDIVLTRYRQASQNIAKEWRRSHPQKWKMISITEFQEPLTEASRSLRGILDSSQHKRLAQLVYQSWEWDVVYYQPIAEQLALSAAQSTRLKDLLVEKIRTTNRWQVALVRATEAERAAIRQSQLRTIDAYHRHIASVLSPDQQAKLNRLCGRSGSIATPKLAASQRQPR